MNHESDSTSSHFSRRALIKGAAAAAAYTLLPKFGTSDAVAAEQSHTLVISAPATPQTLDHEFDVSLGTIDSVAGLFDNPLQYENIPDNQLPDAFPQHIAVHEHKPYNLT